MEEEKEEQENKVDENLVEEENEANNQPEEISLEDSLLILSEVDLGSIPYSAVTQPVPEFLNQGGTLFSTDAVHNTCVSPNFTKHDPSACFETPISISTFLSSS